MAKNMLQLVQEAEQNLQEVLDNHKDELDAFLFDHSIDYPKAKAVVCFVQAIHYALKADTKQ